MTRLALDGIRANRREFSVDLAGPGRHPSEERGVHQSWFVSIHPPIVSEALRWASDPACTAVLPSIGLRATVDPLETVSDDDLADSDAWSETELGETTTALRAARALDSDLDVQQVIGEGGMAVVRFATQRSLGRGVAVKTLRPSARSDAAMQRLLREAWVTGRLEHPNIIPIHDVRVDDEGSPIIVLKRIDGVEWGTVMHDLAFARDRGAPDLLEFNLRILVQICNAVSFAHARGIVHRDLKPANVMIGRFGEVYLVDWGIAVSLREDPTGRLPHVSEAAPSAGTPAYMAPEMIDPSRVPSERTDVYLLGGILHEILTGTPPHEGTFEQIVASILRSRPEYAVTVPPELVAIARRAMSAQEQDRHASADEMRSQIEWYLRHRGALKLCLSAECSLAEMHMLMASRRAEPTTRDQLYRLFAEARFGFRQAIDACANDPRARAGLHATIESMVVFELEGGRADAASAALAELDCPTPELAQRVAAAVRRQQIENRWGKLVDAELDPNTGRPTRVAVGTMLAALWTIAPQFVAQVERLHPAHAHWNAYAISASLAVTAGVLFFFGRKLLLRTAVNRTLIALLLVFFASQLTLLVGCHLMGVSEVHAVVFDLLLAGSVGAVFAATQDRSFWPPAVAFLASFIVAAARPEWRWTMLSGGNLVLLLNFALERRRSALRSVAIREG